MTRRTGLPGDGRLSGLLDETAETGFGRLHELGLAALEEDGQEHVQLAFLVSAEQDPLKVRFTDLHKWVTELDGFGDDPTKSNEGKLEAIQMAWYDEWKDNQE